ncbi:MAG: metallophosphoesterase family protein [Verrucomicrobia bacterium]|nr:metallophosphoesterase family protein [Verrucomicrobiota bacterium]
MRAANLPTLVPKLRTLFLAGTIASLVFNSFATEVTRGPYLQMLSSNRVVLCWRTDTATDSRVRLGTQPGVFTAVTLDDVPKTDHELPLTNLQPGTRYFYAVGSSGGDLVSGADCHFTTAPVFPAPVRIWVMGDTRATIVRDDGDSRQDVREAFLRFAQSRPADLCLNTGDLADNGFDHELQQAFFDVYAGPLRTTPVFPCYGNHDLGTEGGQPYLNAFSLPMNGEMGGVPSGSERYYSFNRPGVHLVVLDCYGTNGIFTAELDPAYRDRQLAWLRADLETNTQPWLVAMFHSPPYSWGSHNSDWEWDMITTRTYFVPLLEEFGVDLVLNGHSHNYERSCLLRGHFGHSSTLTAAMKLDSGDGRPGSGGAYYKPAPQSGTVYAVMGCSGFLGPGVYGHPAMVYTANALGSLVVDIDRDVLRARFLRDTGVVDDYFVIVKGSQPPAARITSARIEGGQIHLTWETVEGFRYRVYRRPTLTTLREQVSEDLVADGFQLRWSGLVGPGRATAFYEVETVAE